MFKGKKGQVITAIFLLLVFLIFWILVIADLLSTWGNQYVLINGSSGLEAFFYQNINLLIMFVVAISVFALASRE